jgi:hypothetical protein
MVQYIRINPDSQNQSYIRTGACIRGEITRPAIGNLHFSAESMEPLDKDEFLDYLIFYG